MRTKKFITSLAAFMVTALLVFVSCEDEENKEAPITVTLSEEVISLVAGTQQTLTASATPSGSIEWLSNKTHVATVNGGVITAVSEGRAKIAAKSGNGTAICEVIVTNVPVSVTGISLNKSELELTVGDYDRLLATIAPEEATNRKVTWTSSNEEVVSVQANGTLKAHSLGGAVITVTTEDGNHTASCTVAVVTTIELLGPTNNSDFLLYPTDPEKNVTFEWRNVEGIDKYILKVSRTDLFEEGDILYTVESTETNIDVAEYDLNEAVKGITGNSIPLYWAIFSGTEGIEALPESRIINVVPDKREYLRLAIGSETSMQVEKMAGEYQFSITANGQATVNTVGLAKEVIPDSGTFVMQYKSNKVLPSLKVRFVKQGGTVAGSIDQAVSTATAWSELRILQTELPSDWGKVGDFIQLDFGNTSNYQMELNAINLQKGVYIPEILAVSPQDRSTIEVLEESENYFKFRSTEHSSTDPVKNPHKTDAFFWVYLTKPIPASATVFSFEYKSPTGLKWGGEWLNTPWSADGSAEPRMGPIYDNIEIYLGPFDFTGTVNYGTNIWAPNNSMPATTEWKEVKIDISARRLQFPTWGQAGHGFRVDPGNYSLGEIFEIRNIQVKQPQAN